MAPEQRGQGLYQHGLMGWRLLDALAPFAVQGVGGAELLALAAAAGVKDWQKGLDRLDADLQEPRHHGFDEHNLLVFK